VTTPAKPAPISARPSARPTAPSATANSSMPTSPTRALAETVRRVPKRSKAMPIGSCTTADARNIAPMTTPISPGPRPKVRCSSLEMTPPPIR